jgi:type II secretory pathway predicted ATPase ExeA
MTYLDALGLKEPPFSKEIADADLWLPTSKQAIADGLLDALHERASVVVVGEPGVGKTCILRAARHLVAAAGYRLTYSHNATLGRRDFYRQLCLALGLAPAATAGNFFYAVSSHVEELARERVHPVFLIDEAHLLHQDTLDHLHILLNVCREALKGPMVNKAILIRAGPDAEGDRERRRRMDRGPATAERSQLPAKTH